MTAGERSEGDEVGELAPVPAGRRRRLGSGSTTAGGDNNNNNGNNNAAPANLTPAAHGLAQLAAVPRRTAGAGPHRKRPKVAVDIEPVPTALTKDAPSTSTVAPSGRVSVPAASAPVVESGAKEGAVSEGVSAAATGAGDAAAGVTANAPEGAATDAPTDSSSVASTTHAAGDTAAPEPSAQG